MYDINRAWDEEFAVTSQSIAKYREIAKQQEEERRRKQQEQQRKQAQTHARYLRRARPARQAGPMLSSNTKRRGGLGIEKDGKVVAAPGTTDADKHLVKLKYLKANDSQNREYYQNLSKQIRADHPQHTVREEEVLGAIFVKEIYTRVLPDFTANVLSAYGDMYVPIQMGPIKKVFGQHTVGPGAISPENTNKAWDYTFNTNHHLSRRATTDLQVRLAQDVEYNIF